MRHVRRSRGRGQAAHLRGGVPAALDFGEISELRQKYGEMADIAPLPSADETKPNIVITEPVNAKPAGDTTGSVLNEREIA